MYTSHAEWRIQESYSARLHHVWSVHAHSEVRLGSLSHILSKSRLHLLYSCTTLRSSHYFSCATNDSMRHIVFSCPWHCKQKISLDKHLPTFLWDLQSVCWEKMCWFQFIHTGNLWIKHHHTLEHLLQFCPLKGPLNDTSSTTWLIASQFQCLAGAHSGGEMNSAGWLPLYLLAPPSTILSFVLHTLGI